MRIGGACHYSPSLSYLSVFIYIGRGWVCACAGPVAHMFSLSYQSVSGGEDTCTQAHTICAQLVAGTTHPLCPTYSYLTAIGSEGAVAPMFSLSYLSLSGGRIHIYSHIRYVRGWCLAPPTLSVLPIYIYIYR